MFEAVVILAAEKSPVSWLPEDVTEGGQIPGSISADYIETTSVTSTVHKQHSVSSQVP